MSETWGTLLLHSRAISTLLALGCSWKACRTSLVTSPGLRRVIAVLSVLVAWRAPVPGHRSARFSSRSRSFSTLRRCTSCCSSACADGGATAEYLFRSSGLISGLGGGAGERSRWRRFVMTYPFGKGVPPL
jgi:hypothetical protein